MQALSAVFRGKYFDGLRKLHARGKLKPDPKACPSGVPEGFDALVSSLREKGWVVYCKEPFAGPEQVLAYLSRYTHRVAIGDGRILKLDTQRGTVSFRYKNYNQGGKIQAMTLEVEDFVRRLGRHILPKRFTKIRHYGILSIRNRKTKVAQARQVLGATMEMEGTAETSESGEMDLHADLDPTLPPCPHCGRPALEVIDIIRGPVILLATRGPPEPKRAGGIL